MGCSFSDVGCIQTDDTPMPRTHTSTDSVRRLFSLHVVASR